MPAVAKARPICLVRIVVDGVTRGRKLAGADADDQNGQGQRCGYLYFAGVIDVLLPERTRIDLKPGTIVNSGSSILGQLIRHKAPPIFDSNIV